jgi:hypothetical protein
LNHIQSKKGIPRESKIHAVGISLLLRAIWKILAKLIMRMQYLNVDIARAKGTPFQIAKLVEQE